MQLSSSKEAAFKVILEDIDKAIAGDVVKPNSIIVEVAQNPVEFASIQTQNLNKAGISEAMGSKAHSMLLQNSNTIAMEETVGSFRLGWNELKDSQKGGKKVKNKGVVAKKGGKVLEAELKLDGGSKKGVWTRLAKRDSKERDHGMQVAEVGSKRKSNGSRLMMGRRKRS